MELRETIRHGSGLRNLGDPPVAAIRRPMHLLQRVMTGTLLLGTLLTTSSMGAERARLVVTGEPLAWKVENQYFTVDFAPNPETGLSGQINTIRVNNGGILLTRGVPNSTLHLSPNSAAGKDWKGINRWDPPPKWQVEMGPESFRLERSGPLPLSPAVEGSCTYEIVPDSPAIAITETIRVLEGTDVSLLRADEWSTVPGATNPFSHIAWAGRTGAELRPRNELPILPLETPWVAFWSEKTGTVLASILDQMTVEGPGEATLSHASLHFAGDPHYFYRAFVFPPPKTDPAAPDPLVRLPRGSVYRVKYHLLAFRAGDWDAALRKIEELVGSETSAGLPPQKIEPGDLQLPKPRKDGGKPLMQALQERASTRAFAQRKLSIQQLSDLLWAAAGVNRPDGHRTVPSAMNRQETDVYVILEEGAYLYEAAPHRLKQVSKADLRALAGTQDYARTAPVNLVYVADMSKAAGSDDPTRTLYSGSSAGSIGQNVYLYAASEGLATVIRASVDRTALAAALGLRPDQNITLAQSVGFPNE